MAANYRAKSNDNFNKKIIFYLFKKVKARSQKIDLEEFLKFNLTKEIELIKIYTTQYFKYDGDETIDTINGLTPNQVYGELEILKKHLKPLEAEWKAQYFETVFKLQFPEAEFNELVKSDTCYYCKTSQETFDNLYQQHQITTKTSRGFNLEIDRLDPNQDYTPGNCVMSCYWCNNAKTDEFTEAEFKSVGEAIRQIWLERLD